MQRLSTAIALLAATAWTPTAQGGDALPAPSRIGLSLSRVAAVHGYGFLPVQRPIANTWLLRQDPGALDLVILSSDTARTAEAVARNGGRVGTVTESVVTARLPLASLWTLMAEKSVVYADIPAEKAVKLNISAPDVGSPDVNAGNSLPMPLDGTGVVLGIVDTGIDVSHPEFRKSDNTSRIKYYWVQTRDPAVNPPPEFGYGMECSGDALDKSTCDAADFLGHGTHCSGIMGSGGKKYRGMAPGGVFVVAGGLTNIVDGVGYVMKRAEKLGLPVTVNLSLGWHAGAHDGTTPEELGLAELGNKPGHIIIAAAGNEGSDYIHLGYTAGPTPNKTIIEARVEPTLGIETAAFDIWAAQGALMQFAIGIQDKNGVEIAESDWYETEMGLGPVQRTLEKTGVKYGEVAFDSQMYSRNGKFETVIFLKPSTGNPDTAYGNKDGYEWYIKAKGAGWFDAWSVSESALSAPPGFSNKTGPGMVPGDNDRSLGMPAASPGIIAVAAYVSRTSWRDVDGETRNISGTVGDIAFFSSHGPSGDEARTGLKPEIAAPGRIVASAMASGSIVLSPGTQVDSAHVMMQGTSMACPHVNGVVALMLQADPQLTVEKARRILMKTALKDSFTGDADNHVWGAGKLRALPAVKMALGIGFCESDSDCKEGRTCVKGACLQKKGGVCYAGGDCMDGVACVDGKCGSNEPIDGGGGADGGRGEGGGCACASVGLQAAGD
jgi:subtilisin family serine protease